MQNENVKKNLKVMNLCIWKKNNAGVVSHSGYLYIRECYMFVRLSFKK